MFLPTSTSAISIDNISKAVPESKPLLSTVLDMLSGFSNTSAWAAEEPTVVTIPSPTLAIIVSSPAPPTSLSILALTVTLAFTITSIPFLATADILGVSITLGFTLTWTASNTFLPAKSIAAALSNTKGILALCAAIKASTSVFTLPPAK